MTIEDGGNDRNDHHNDDDNSNHTTEPPAVDQLINCVLVNKPSSIDATLIAPYYLVYRWCGVAVWCIVYSVWCVIPRAVSLPHNAGHFCPASWQVERVGVCPAAAKADCVYLPAPHLTST